MKIVFLCGSLEPGRDGVGDYTRRLAGELIRHGHKAYAIALNDRSVSTIVEEEQLDGETTLSVFRLPSSLCFKEKSQPAKEWINSINPDWLSLQFVPFAFQPKGLPFGLGHFLGKIGKGRMWHVMFHELWVGMNTQATYKEVFWGYFQKKVIQSICNRLCPAVVHTQTGIYKEQLKRLGANPHLLPLYGNISFNKNNQATFSRQHVLKKKVLLFVLFGAIHPGAPVFQFATEAFNYSQQKGCPVNLTIVGRSGLEKKIWIDAWKSKGLEVEVLGEQDPVVISSILEKASFGITTTPFLLVEKSGTVAAMREHSLPVICVSHPWDVRGFSILKKIAGVVEYRVGNFQKCLSFEPNDTYSPPTSNVTRQFVTQLLNGNNSIVNKQETAYSS